MLLCPTSEAFINIILPCMCLKYLDVAFLGLKLYSMCVSSV